MCRRLVQLLSFLAVIVCSNFLAAQEYNPVPKNAEDGRLIDWGREIFFNPNTKEHLYDNEAQNMENAEYLFGLVPPGEGPTAVEYDSPLSADRVHPDGQPMGNSFNIVSSLVCFDPTVKGGTYWVAIDLPGPTNDYMSEGFHNRYVYDNFVEEWFPVPFDSDCNENPDLVDDIASGGYGSIVDTVEEHEMEFYRIWLWVGGDPTQVPDEGSGEELSLGNTASLTGDSKDVYDGPGFPIVIVWEENINGFIPYYWEAFVPAKYVKNSSSNLVLGSSAGGGMGLVLHSDPKGAVKPEYDVEMEINHIITEIFPLIDLVEAGKPGAEPMDFWDMFLSYVRMKADSDGDFSDEEEWLVGLDAPRLPMVVEVEKKVYCGNCGDVEDPIASWPTSKDDWVAALPGSELLFFVHVTIPKDNPGYVGNGMGYVRGFDLIDQTSGNVQPGSFELCHDDITLNGVKGIIDVPDFDIDGTEWVIVAKGTQDPFIFNVHDPIFGGEDLEILIPFKVTIDPDFFGGPGIDLLNTVETWGDNGVVEQDPHAQDIAWAYVLEPELSCNKWLEVRDKDGTLLGEGTDLVISADAEYPLTATYRLTVLNSGETQVSFEEDALEDICLCLIPDLTGVDFCTGVTNPAQTLDPGGNFTVDLVWTIDEYQEFKEAYEILEPQACTVGDAILNLFTADGTVVVDGEIFGIPYYICNDGQIIDVSCESNQVTLGIEPPQAVVDVQKLVSCDDGSFSQKLVDALPGAEIYFQLTVTNPAGAPVDHDHTWFGDNLTGECVYAGKFEIVTPGYSINPPNFVPNGASTYEILPPLEVGQSVVMTFRAVTDPDWSQIGVGPECANTLGGFADGPDSGTAIDDSDTDFANADIKVPDISCTKLVKVTTDFGGGGAKVYGPAQTIGNIPRTDPYPWKVEWNIEVSNDGETYLNADITDPLIQNYTGNDCNLPQALNLAGGATDNILCTEIIDDYQENYLLDSQDVGGFDEWVNNWVRGTNIQVDYQGGSSSICYIFNGQPAASVNLDDIQCNSLYRAQPPFAEITVEKLVSCDNVNFSEKLVDALPGADIFFQLTVTNPGGAQVDHEHTWFSDELTGECDYANAFTIHTPGYTISPGTFNPDGTTFEIVPPLDIGESVVMTFKAVTDPNWVQMGTGPECDNNLEGYADGPDMDTDIDDTDSDFANADIKVPDASCTKTVKVITDFGGPNQKSYGPAQSIPNIPSTDRYPWKAEWTIVVSNDGETYLDLDLTDPLIEGFTGNDCNLPQAINLAGGATQTVVCTEVIDSYLENKLLDSNDPGGYDKWVDNWVTGENVAVDPDPTGGDPICYLHNGQPAASASLDDIQCNSRYKADPPEAEIEVLKLVSCDDTNFSEKLVDALPGADIFFQLTVTNPATAPVEHEHTLFGDSLTGECTYAGEFKIVTPGYSINPPNFIPNGSSTYEILPPLDIGESVVMTFKAVTDPDWTQIGVGPECANTLAGFADGPDEGNNPEAQDTDFSNADIKVPQIACVKVVQVTTDFGGANPEVYGPAQTIPNIPNTDLYPWKVEWGIQVVNSGETYLDATVTDPLIEGYTGNDCNLPQNVNIANGGNKIIVCTEIVSDYGENSILDSQDQGGFDTWVNNWVAGTNITVDPDPAGGDPLCYLHNGQPAASAGLADIDCNAKYKVEPPEAEIEVEKLVSCDETNFSEKLVDALPGAEIYFRLTVTNPGTAAVDHDHTWFADNLNGECTYANEFVIVTPGYSIDPPVFEPDGVTIYEIMPPLKIGESVVMTFRAQTDPDWEQIGTGPEIANTLGGYADGPDLGIQVDDSETDFANADIKVPDISCTKVVKVTTDFGGGGQKVYGPDQTIGNIPRSDPYPWKVEWTIDVSNDGETYLNAEISDPLIEGFTGNDCGLPQTLNIADGDVESIVCTEIIDDYNENELLNTQDPGGFDEWVNNWVAGSNITVDPDPAGGDPVCYLFNGQPVPASALDDIQCDAKYNAPAPCGEIEIVEKLVSCYENTGYADSVEALPGAWVYYKFTVRNPSSTVDLEHAWAQDTLSGEYLNFTPIDPPDFEINTSYPGYDLGALPAGQSLTVKYKVQVDPAYDVAGPPEEITNTLIVYADGPDVDEDPDPVGECPEAVATVTAGSVNIVVPDLACEKLVFVLDADGIYYPGGSPTTPPPVPEVYLPAAVTYPIEVYFFMTATNTGEVDLPEVDMTDEVITNLVQGIPPGIDIELLPANPQWDDNEILVGNDWSLICKITLDSYSEAHTLAINDEDPQASNSIDNLFGAVQEIFDPEDICGTTLEDLEDESLSRVHIVEQETNIPTLDEVGIVLMILLLGGLIVWRTLRTS